MYRFQNRNLPGTYVFVDEVDENVLLIYVKWG